MKPDIKKAISLDDNEEEVIEEETETEKKHKSIIPKATKTPKPRKKIVSKKKNTSKNIKNTLKAQEIRQQQEQEAYAKEEVPEAHKIYRELKKIRKLLSTFKEVDIKYDRGDFHALKPPVMPFQPLVNLKKLGDYKEAPTQNITPQAPQTQNPAPVLIKNPPLAKIPSATALTAVTSMPVAEQSFCPPPLLNNPQTLCNPNEIVLDNSKSQINLKRCPNCNKKFNSFFGLWRKGRSKIIHENGEVKQTLFCKGCGWNKEIRFVI